MREMTLYGVSFEPIGKQPIVLLKTADDDRFLPIWIGHPEAAAILMKLQGASPPRPMTHDLFTDVISELQGEVVRVTVTELRDTTYFASITTSPSRTKTTKSLPSGDHPTPLTDTSSAVPLKVAWRRIGG